MSCDKIEKEIGRIITEAIRSMKISLYAENEVHAFLGYHELTNEDETIVRIRLSKLLEDYVESGMCDAEDFELKRLIRILDKCSRAAKAELGRVGRND